MGDKNINLSASIKVGSKPKDGTDGVGITSADVVFAQSKSNTNPPADSDNWKTKVNELTLVDGYLWSGTKIFYSNKNSAITGKYCIGSTRDFTDIEELYYLSDSGDTVPTGNFQSSFKPEKGKYLWTCIRYRFKAASGSAENSNWVYSAKTCVGYFGDDGISVQSSDVVFGISTKEKQPTSWKTTFGELTLEKGKYVWTCTKITLTGNKTTYTGAYCLGECYDFAKVGEMYALSDSATQAPESGWNASYTPVKGKYLWSCVKVIYNKNSTEYVNQRCVSYFPNDGKKGNDGTSFNLLGTAAGHMKTWVKPSPFVWNSIYLVDGANGGYPMTYKITTDGTKSAKAEVGDAYIIDGNLWVANTTAWVNVGNIQGAPGEQGIQGDPGKDAVNIVFSPAEIVFDADEQGNIASSQYDGRTSTLKVFRGRNELAYGTQWTCEVNSNNLGDNCKYFFYKNGTAVTCKFKDITSAEITGSTSVVSASAGGGAFKITVDDATYNAYLSFSVNVNTFAKVLIQDNKQYIQKYTEVSNKYTEVSTELDNKANQNDLKEVESTIAQMPDQIKMEVYSKTAGRRNMLPNSAFRNQDSVHIHSSALIEKTTGKDGVNCIHSSDKYSGTGDGNYIGAFWDSTQKNGFVTNIPIVKGKKYVISCWIKSDNKDLPFNIECIYMKSINQQSRTDSKRADGQSFKVDNVGEWKLISLVLDTDNTDATSYLAVNFWSNNKNVPKAGSSTDYPTCNAYICKPMMEEADTYKGWTLSEDDYDYVGGNLLDNTRALEKSGNLEKANGETIIEGYEYAYAVAHCNNTTAQNVELLQWGVTGIVTDGKDYMFSFLAKGTGTIATYLYKDNTPLFFAEGVNGKYNEASTDGNVMIDLTSEWRRYWVHYRMKVSSGHPLPEKLLMRCIRGNEVYVCQPKLEVGATMTEYTERKTDLVDKASLKKAGIEITTDQVKLYGDKVQVLTRKDGTTQYDEAAMFSNGKLNANLINAETIVVNGLQGKNIDAKNATISNLRANNIILSGSYRSPFRKVVDSLDSGYHDNAVMMVDNDGWKVSYSIPWNVEQAGRRICVLSNLWGGKQITSGSVSIGIPQAAKEAGCRFFENGFAKTELNFSTEVLELLAYGDVSERTDNDEKSHYLYGWIVLNRIDLMTVHKYGREKKVLAYGKVSGFPTGASVKYKTFDGTKNLTVMRNGLGIYTISIPKDNNWFSSIDDIFVTLTGVGYCYDGNNIGTSPSKATLLGTSLNLKNEFCIKVEVSDDETPNDGSFNFEISNFSDFNY